MSRVIVTGANGFIGKNLVKALIDNHYEVVALDVCFDSFFENNAHIYCVNVKYKTVSALLKEIPHQKYDCFFHFAWVGTSGTRRTDYLIQLENVKLTCEYVKLCSDLGCKRFLYASSINEMETYEYLQSDNISPSGGYIYGTGKLSAHLMGETYAKMNSVDFIPVIITNIYGIGEKSARLVYSSLCKLINDQRCSFTSGEQFYDFIYISDAINSIIAVSQKGNPYNRYYIGSGEPKPLKDFLIEMRDIVSPSTYIGLGDIEFNGIDISYSQFDLKKVEKDTGYVNKIPFGLGIKMTAEWIKSEM